MDAAIISTADFPTADAVKEVASNYRAAVKETNTTPCLLLDLVDTHVATSPVYDSGNSTVLDSVHISKSLKVFLTYKTSDPASESLGSLGSENLVLELHTTKLPSHVVEGSKLYLQHGMIALNVESVQDTMVIAAVVKEGVLSKGGHCKIPPGPAISS